MKAPREFILFLKGLNHEKINWVLSWWNIDTFIIRTYLQGCVVTAGLEKAFFYCPRCLKRQWGEFQAIPREFFPYFSESISQRIVDRISSTWGERVIHTKQEGTKRTDSGSLYESWLVYDVEQSERENILRASRLVAKLGNAKEEGVEAQGMKRKAT